MPHLDPQERPGHTVDRMSALGQKRSFAPVSGMSALPPKADIRLLSAQWLLLTQSGRL
jgi:hypothetical protein